MHPESRFIQAALPSTSTFVRHGYGFRWPGLLSASIGLGNCGYGDFVPSSDANEFAFFCEGFVAGGWNRAHCPAEGGASLSNTLADQPWPRGCGLAEAFWSSDDNQLAIIQNDGAIYQMDTATQEFGPTAVTGDCRKSTIAHLPWPRSADGAKVYLGYRWRCSRRDVCGDGASCLRHSHMDTGRTGPDQRPLLERGSRP